MSIWQRLENALGGGGAGQESTSPDPARQQLAAALLLVEIARADHADDPQEFAAIARVVREHFGLGAEEAEELLEAAAREQASAISFDRHIRELNESFTVAQKRALLQSLWQVAYADGELHAYEEQLMRRLADLLFLSHADFIQAKLGVTGE